MFHKIPTKCINCWNYQNQCCFGKSLSGGRGSFPIQQIPLQLSQDVLQSWIFTPQTILTHVAFKSNCWKSWKQQLNEFSFRTWKKWAVETSTTSQSCHPSHQSEWHQLCCQASQKAFHLESSLGKEAFQDRIYHSEIFCSRKVGVNSITCKSLHRVENCDSLCHYKFLVYFPELAISNILKL